MAKFKGTFLLEAQSTTSSVILTWDKPSGPLPIYYDITRDGTALVTRVKWALTRTDSAVVAGAVYTYRVRAYGSFSSEGEALSNTVTETVPPVLVPLTAPDLTATSGAAQVSLSWTAVTNADSYSWQRATGAGAFGASTNTTSLTATDGTVVNGTEYRFRVRGTSNAGADTGPWSNIPSVTPTAGEPVAPTLTGEAGDSQNTLEWNAVANAVTYRLRRQVGADPMTVVTDTDATDYLDSTVANDITYRYTVRGNTGSALGSVSNPVDLTPVAAEPPEEPPYVGYAAMAFVSGGGTVAATNVSTFAQLRTALEASGPRVINITGNNVIDGGGVKLSVTNGNLTLDGTAHTRSIKRLSLVIRASNVIITNVRLRSGDELADPDAGNGLDINPMPGQSIDRIMLDHCSIMWGPAVNLTVQNRVYDVTVQHCLIGPGLRFSRQSETDPGLHNMAMNVRSLTDATQYGQRMTFYRNFITHHVARNLRFLQTNYVDYINNVTYNWEQWVGRSNPRRINVIANMFHKGPSSPASNEIYEVTGDPAGAGDPLHNASTYIPLTGVDANIGRTAAGAAFTPTVDWTVLPTAQVNARLGTLSVTPQPMTADLATAIVAAAGPLTEDAVDAEMKNDYNTRTGTTVWRGIDYAAPKPYWP